MAALRPLGGRLDAAAAGTDRPDQLSAPTDGLAWTQARLLWRPEGVELRIPLHLGWGAIAALASDGVWEQGPLAGLRREIWAGWLALASPTLLQDIDPEQLRLLLDEAVARALEHSGAEPAREDFGQLGEASVLPPAVVLATSVTATLATVTLPVLLTRKSQVIFWPTLVTGSGLPGASDFTSVNDGDCVADTVAEDGGDSTEPPEGVVPVAVAAFVIDPAFTSA